MTRTVLINRHFQSIEALEGTPATRSVALQRQRLKVQAVLGDMLAYTPTDGKTRDEFETAIRQLVACAVASDQIIDFFA